MTTPVAFGGRPPAEYRRLGLDRRTFALPLVALGVIVLWAVIAPAVNRSLDYGQPVVAGDVFIVGPDTTMAPPVGWDVQAGVRLRDQARVTPGEAARMVVAGDGVTVSTQAGAFTGDARALNAQVLRNDKTIAADSGFAVKGPLDTVTIDGREGVARRFTTLTGEGAVFTFAKDGSGLSILISGRLNALQGDVDVIGRMLASLDFDRKLGA